MYTVADYGMMLACRARTEAYARALEQAVKPGSVVVDIGAGTGVLALLAAGFGARKVYAIEPEDVIQVAREISRANGLDKVIEFIQDVSTRVRLPERAQVVVSDLHGTLPFLGNHLLAIQDARQRLLAPGGVLIPREDRLWCAAVEAPDLHRPVACWEEDSYGLAMGAARQLASNCWRKGRVLQEQVRVGPSRLGRIDYTTVESPDFSAAVDWEVDRGGIAHGLLVWFDSTLADGLELTNAPGGPELVYGSAFFPWPEAVRLAPGDRLRLLWEAHFSGGAYVFRWETRILEADDPARVKADFRQSTFFGEPLNPASLQKRSPNHRPELEEDGQIDRLILDLMDGNAVLEQIARQVQERFPARFPAWQAALTRVGELSLRYSR